MSKQTSNKFSPEVRSRAVRLATRAARRCHAKLAVWLIELWSKRRASRLANLARAGATLTCARQAALS